MGFARHNTPQNNAIFNALGVSHCYGDICDSHLLRRLFRGVDVVVHCAAKIDIYNNRTGVVEKTNVDGTRAVVEAAAVEKVKQLVHFSSMHARDFNARTTVVDERTPLAINYPIEYNRTKAAAEQYVLAQKKIDNVTVLEPTSILGPNDYKPSEMGQVIINMARNRQPFIVQAGDDWVDVRDVCRATLTVIENPKKRQSYLVGGHFVSLKDMARTVAALEHRTVVRIALPVWAARMGLPAAYAYSKIRRRPTKFTRDALTHLADSNDRMSSRKAAADFGYGVRPFVDTIMDALAWYREHNMIGARRQPTMADA